MLNTGTLSKKRRIVHDGVFRAELFEFFKRELSDCGFGGCDHRITGKRLEVVIKATKTREALGDERRRIRELTACLSQRFSIPPGGLCLMVDRIKIRGLSAMAQAENLRAKLLDNVIVRRACSGIVRYVMESGAKGCEVTVSGKIKGQRAKAMTFRDGYMIKSGTAHRNFVDVATRHCHLRAGTIGVKVKIMLPEPKQGNAELPDVVKIIPPKGVSEEIIVQ